MKNWHFCLWFGFECFLLFGGALNCFSAEIGDQAVPKRSPEEQIARAIEASPEWLSENIDELNRSISMPASVEAAGTVNLMDMPKEDENRARVQMRLIGLIENALRARHYDPALQRRAAEALRQSAQSKYIAVRITSMNTVMRLDGKGAEDALMKILEDKSEDVRVRSYAAYALSQVGDASTVDKLNGILEKRKSLAEGVNAENDAISTAVIRAMDKLNRKLNGTGTGKVEGSQDREISPATDGREKEEKAKEISPTE